MKKLFSLLLAVAIVLSLSCCAAKEDATSPAAEETHEAETIAIQETSEPEIDPEESESAEPAATIDAVITILNGSPNPFDYRKIYESGGNIVCDIATKGIREFVDSGVLTGDPKALEGWESIKNNIPAIRDSFMQILDTMSVENADVIVNILDDTDMETVIYTLANDGVIYDIAADQAKSVPDKSIPATSDEIDLSGMSFDELVALKDKINLAIWNSEEWQEVDVPIGVWVVGEDIPAGKWTLTCKNGYLSSITWGMGLTETKEDIDSSAGKHGYQAFYNPNDKNGKEKEPFEYTLEAEDGMFVIIEHATATFSPFSGKPDLGFK